MTVRKKWSTTWDSITGGRVTHSGKAAAYRWVREQAGMGERLRSKRIRVHFDERDGRGWQLYEQIDLRELAALENIDTDEENG